MSGSFFFVSGQAVFGVVYLGSINTCSCIIFVLFCFVGNPFCHFGSQMGRKWVGNGSEMGQIGLWPLFGTMFSDVGPRWVCDCMFLLN